MTEQSLPEHDVESESKTRIVFDLQDVLTAEELAAFQRSAADAKAPTLTEHLLNITLRVPKDQHAA